MSFKAITWVYTVPGLSISETAILANLAARADDHGKCFPAQSTIAKDCNMDRSTVKRALRKFRQMGLIKTTRRTAKWGRDTSSMITLRVWGPGSACPPEGVMVTGGGGQADPLFHESPSESPSNLKTAAPSVLQMDSDFEQDQEVRGILDMMNSNLKLNGIRGPSDLKLRDFVIECSSELTVASAIARARYDNGNYSGPRLERLWRDLKTILKIGAFQLPLTRKQRGQFTHVVVKFADGPDVGPLLALILQNWAGFGKYVVSQCAAYQFPDQPVIGFFLEHADLAVAYRDHLQAIAKDPLGGLKPVTKF